MGQKKLKLVWAHHLEMHFYVETEKGKHLVIETIFFKEAKNGKHLISTHHMPRHFFIKTIKENIICLTRPWSLSSTVICWSFLYHVISGVGIPQDWHLNSTLSLVGLILWWLFNFSPLQVGFPKNKNFYLKIQSW